MQRFLDIFFSFFLIVILVPVFIPLMIILFLTGENKIFYLQERIGKNKKKFKIIKFVTMLENSPNTLSGTITVKNDPRILPLGRFLRKTKINELPQILNIFCGDMSFVGPRPLTSKTFDYYDELTKNIISSVRPGLSGVGSIFFRNEEEILDKKGKIEIDLLYQNYISKYKGQLETWYVKNNSIKLYFLVLILTLIVVLFPKTNLTNFFFKGLPEIPK